MPDSGIFIYNEINYLAGFVASWIGDAGAAFCINYFRVSITNVPVKLKEDSNISAINIADNVQVLLSKSLKFFVHHLFVLIHLMKMKVHHL
jgi:hypothetical protein